MDVFTLVATLELSAKPFYNGLSSAASALVDFTKQAVKTGADFDYAMANVKAVTGEFQGDINELIKMADKLGIAYQEGANDTETAFNIIRAKALQSSAQTRYTAEETADALKYMGMAGWDPIKMFTGLDAVMDAAAASGMNVGRASDIITDALTAFHQPAEEAGHLVDVLATAAAKSNTNINMLGESFKMTAPIAGQLGYSFEDVSLALGLMANAGVKSSMAGRAMRNFLTNLASLPTDKIKQAAIDLGISISDSEGNLLSLRDIMVQLRSMGGEMAAGEYSSAGLSDWVEEYATNRFGKLSPEYSALTNVVHDLKEETIGWQEAYEQMVDILGDEFSLEDEAEFLKAAQVLTETGTEKLIDVIYKLGGKQALPALLALISASEEDFNALAASLDNSAGAGERMRNTMLDNLTGDLYILNSNLDLLRVGISDKITPTLREFVQFATGGIADITNAVNEGGIEALPGAVEKFLSGADDLIQTHTPEITAAVDSLFRIIGKVIEVGWPYVEKGLGVIWGYAEPVILGWITDIINEMPSILTSAFSDILTGLAKDVKNIPIFGPAISEILNTLGMGGYSRGSSYNLGGGDMTAQQAAQFVYQKYLGVNDRESLWAAVTEAYNAGKTTVDEFEQYLESKGLKVTVDTSEAEEGLLNLEELLGTIGNATVKVFFGDYTGADSQGISDARSMSGGTILRGATMFGWDSDGIPHIGGGEGAEAVVGVNSLDQMIQQSVNKAVSGIINGLNGILSGGTRQPVYLVLDSGALVAEIAPSMDSELSRIDTWRNGGGR